MCPLDVVRASWLFVGVGGLNTDTPLPARAWRDGLDEVDEPCGDALAAPVHDWCTGVARPQGASGSGSTRR